MYRQMLSDSDYQNIAGSKIFLPADSLPTIPPDMTFKEWEAHEYKVLKPRLRHLKLKLGKKLADASCVTIYRPKKLEEIYGRSDLCLKVFKLSKSVWGFHNSANPSSIIASTIAQNLLALHGYAPRVYDLVEVKGKTAQVTDYVGGPNKMIEVRDSRMVLDARVWGGKENFVGGMFVDFEGTYLRDYNDYRAFLIREIARVNEENGHCEGMYQSVYNNPGIRNTDARLKALDFKDFEGKSVLDIGCANGMMCRAACDLGAKIVVGIEHSNMARLAAELAFMDGYFDIDFYGADIRKLSRDQLEQLTKVNRFDIHLFLAMEGHVGWPEWVKDCDTLYYESHGQPRKIKVFDRKGNLLREATYND